MIMKRMRRMSGVQFVTLFIAIAATCGWFAR
jgi:hypothetical protein